MSIETCERCVMSWLELNLATTLFKTSLQIDGKTEENKENVNNICEEW